VTIDLGPAAPSRPVDLLAPDAPAAVAGPLRLPPFGAAVLREDPHSER
jgi:beta-galactosidase